MGTLGFLVVPGHRPQPPGPDCDFASGLVGGVAERASGISSDAGLDQRISGAEGFRLEGLRDALVCLQFGARDLKPSALKQQLETPNLKPSARNSKELPRCSQCSCSFDCCEALLSSLGASLYLHMCLSTYLHTHTSIRST